MALNTAKNAVQVKEMDKTYEDDPSYAERIHRVENYNESSEWKVCKQKF